MNSDIKRRWIEALRSGQYKQGRAALRRPPYGKDTQDTYCCLGVLCDIIEPNSWVCEEVRCYHDNRVGFPSARIMEIAGLSGTFADELARINDRGDSFEDIIQVIELEP